MNHLVLMTPIKAGKTHLLKEPQFLIDEECLFFTEVGISMYHRWIQKIRDEDFLIHLIKGEDIGNSFKIIREKINQSDHAATQLQQLYKEALGIDLGEEDFIPSIYELTEMLDVEIENNNSYIKEYCFIYPIIPSKKEKLLQMYQDKDTYFNSQIQNIYRFRGISKIQFWIQESSERPYIMIYQEITGPVSDARDKYLDSKEDELSTRIAREFSDITGLSYEELLPTLESLVDFEVLN